jgi:hypothetical protein
VANPYPLGERTNNSNYVVAVLLVAGAMALAVSGIIGAVVTGVIPVGRTRQIDRRKTPLVFWLVILAAVGVVAMCAVNLIRFPPH